MKIEHLKRVWTEIVELGEDLQYLCGSLYEQWMVLWTLLGDLWNIGVQVIAIVLKMIPLVEKMVDRIKAIKIEP